MACPTPSPSTTPPGRYSFSHNGDFVAPRRWRRRYRAPRAGSRAAPTPRSAPAGSRTPGATTRPCHADLAALHETFGGQANLAVLTATGDAHHYAGNRENPVFTFRLGRIGIAGTGIYSLDRSVFRFVAPGATERRLVALGTTASLDTEGRPTAA